MNIRQLNVKVANSQFDRMRCRKLSATVVSECAVFVLGSVCGDIVRVLS